MNIGFSIIGQELDAGSNKPRRWNKFRPSVAFALQQDIPMDKIVLAYQSGQENLLNVLKNDILSVNSKIEIDTVELHFREPYDYDNCYKVIVKAISKICQTKDSVFFHVNTGTHTMHFAMYIISEKQVFPTKLVQTAPNKTNKNKVSNTTKSNAKIIDLSWTNYHEVIDKAKDSRKKSAINLSVVESFNKEYQKQIEELSEISSKTDEPILLLGATGSGKSIRAKKIHEERCKYINKQYNTKEKERPFKSVDCGCLNDSQIIQSTLFGHKKGTFTGAIDDRKGFIEAADGGTLFLDEIGNLDLQTQARLLTVLETGEFQRVGETENRKSKFRLICATNKDLNTEIEKGKFREDLYTRIRSWQYILPSLKDRSEDIENNIEYELNRWFDDKIIERRSRVNFEKKALKIYLKFAKSSEAIWTGNFRDLGQSIRRMATLASLKKEGGACIISENLVKIEIKNLKNFWSDTSEMPEVNNRKLFKIICKQANKTKPEMASMDAIEWLMQQEMLAECKNNKANAGRQLYQAKDETLRNPSSKFKEKCNLLIKKYS